MDCTGLVCCKPCHPRYRRLVDNIYPTNPHEGLVVSNMQKLTFYAISHPEKLDRIGEYLAYRLSRDIYRERIPLVKVSVEAMDRLLTACHGSPSLNLFVESFLKMVHRLLETQSSELQILATQSFVNFSNIDEDTPSYHRRYDFFISKFSAMCHNNNTNISLKRKLRLAGIRGLRGVVRKTVSDDLQANIWEPQHMDKIVPSLLYNQHDEIEIEDEVDSDATDEVPRLLADACMRELTGKASYGNLKFLLTPLLRHFDLHRLWSAPDHFAVTVFKAIMFSIQSQYSFLVIQILMSHLDQHTQAPVAVRIGIATVLAEIVIIAATGSIGPGLLEILNSLLRHLRYSVEFQFSEKCKSETEEKRYQETLINSMGEFANNLPDYQKVEVMMFIIGKVPMSVTDKKSDWILQNVLVRTLLKVATKYRTGHLATALASSFLDPLLRLADSEGAEVRLLIQQTIHNLLDRHNNLPMMEHLCCNGDIGDLQLNVEKCSRSDMLFMRKNLPAITHALFKSVQRGNNSRENYEAILTTMALICLELGNEETLIELYRLALGFQALVVDSPAGADNLTPLQKAVMHNTVAKYFNFASQLMAIPALCAHVQEVIRLRAEKVRWLDLFDSNPPAPEDDFVLDDALLFDRNKVVEALQSTGHDTTRLNMPLLPRPTSESLRGAKSPNDEQSVGGGFSVDMASANSTPLTSRRGTWTRGQDGTTVPITFTMLKQFAAMPIEKLREEEHEKALKVVEMYRTLPFEELVKRNKQYQHNMAETIEKVLGKVKEKDALLHGTESPTRRLKSAHDIQFPELFVY